jgi:hypothetical protein
MQPARGRRAAILTACGGLTLLAAFGLFNRQRIVEEWYIHALRSADDQTRVHAARKLAEMHCVRAVPYLLEAIRVDDRELSGRFLISSNGGGGIVLTPLLYSLYLLGPGARHGTEEALKTMKFGDDLEAMNSNLKLTQEVDEVIEAWNDPGPKVEEMEYESR